MYWLQTSYQEELIYQAAAFSWVDSLQKEVNDINISCPRRNFQRNFQSGVKKRYFGHAILCGLFCLQLLQLGDTTCDIMYKLHYDQ